MNFLGVFGLGEIKFRGDLGAHIGRHDQGREDRFNPRDVILLQALAVLELVRIERTTAVVIVLGAKQVAVLVNDADVFCIELRHAVRDQMDHRADLRAVEGATGGQIEQHRGAGLGLIAHESGRFGQRQMHARRLH